MAKRVVVLYPFFSQQNKETGKFLFRSCGSTKILQFIGERLLRESMADQIRFVAPDIKFWGDDLSKVVPEEWIYSCRILPDNRLQRLEWPVRSWDYIFGGGEGGVGREGGVARADLVFNMHELIGWPLKKLYPETRVISMFTVSPDAEPWPWMSPLVDLSIQNSDLVTVPSETMLKFIWSSNPTALAKWPLSFDQEELDRLLVLPPSGKPPVNVLFVFRASASNYTHHREFIEAIKILRKETGSGILVAFTDTTRYLRSNPEEMAGLSKDDVEILDDPGDQEKYADLLRRSRIVVGMNDNMHGGMGVREAMYAGAVPVLLDAPCYRELMNSEIEWLGWIPSPVTSEGIAHALSEVLGLTKNDFRSLRHYSVGRARLEAFEETWKVMKPQINQLLEKGN